MTLDTLDRAFVTRWQSRRAKPQRTQDIIQPIMVSSIVEPEQVTAVPTAAIEASSVDPEPVDPEPVDPEPVDPPPTDPEPAVAAQAEQSLVDRLLVAGREEWECLADEVEAARLAGHRVIAVVGGEPGEGRSTLVECLTQKLRDRGRDVVVLTTADEATDLEGVPTDGVRQHDRRIILVDAGVWFPPGPIRRHRLVTESVGYDAAILVRRADRDQVPSRATALAALGMAVLGEVVTFALTQGDT